MSQLKQRLLKKGDTVVVIAGKDKGKTGKVLEVLVRKDRVLVAGVNIIKKHQRPTAKNDKGGIVEKEAPLHHSNVMLYSSKLNKGVRVAVKSKTDGHVVRVCRKTGEEF